MQRAATTSVAAQTGPAGLEPATPTYGSPNSAAEQPQNASADGGNGAETTSNVTESTPETVNKPSTNPRRRRRGRS